MTARESQTALEHSTKIPFASHFYNAIGARTRVSGSFSSHRCFRQREWSLIGCDKDGALVVPEVPRPATEHAPTHGLPPHPTRARCRFLSGGVERQEYVNGLYANLTVGGTLTYSLPPFANPAPSFLELRIWHRSSPTTTTAHAHRLIRILILASPRCSKPIPPSAH